MNDTPPKDEARAESARRRFLKQFTGIFGGLIGLAMGIPFVSALIGPSFKLKKLHWSKVGDLGSLELKKPVNLSFPFRTVDAYVTKTEQNSVWVVKESDTVIKVFSPICPHLGCHYNWIPSRGDFVCPCHGSVFTPEGKVIGGPAPRPLDALPWKVEKGVLYVKWERFEPGIPQKVRI